METQLDNKEKSGISKSKKREEGAVDSELPVYHLKETCLSPLAQWKMENYILEVCETKHKIIGQ